MTYLSQKLVVVTEINGESTNHKHEVFDDCIPECGQNV